MKRERIWAGTVLAGLFGLFAVGIIRQQEESSAAELRTARARAESLEARLAAAKAESAEVARRYGVTRDREAYQRDWQRLMQTYPTPAEIMELARLRDRIEEVNDPTNRP